MEESPSEESEVPKKRRPSCSDLKRNDRTGPTGGSLKHFFEMDRRGTRGPKQGELRGGDGFELSLQQEPHNGAKEDWGSQKKRTAHQGRREITLLLTEAAGKGGEECGKKGKKMEGARFSITAISAMADLTACRVKVLAHKSRVSKKR